MNIRIPRILIAGLAGDSGKTVVSLSLILGLRRSGRTVSVYKKGPDYIDASWLSRAAQGECHNLDTYLAEPEDVFRLFARCAARCDMAVIEGNRGIFDGKDADGTHSTAELAKLLRSPVVLCVDSTKMTRTAAALVQGCRNFDPEVEIAGVIFNRVAGFRHRRILSETVEKYCGLPTLGSIPKLEEIIPERHLGLIPPQEFHALVERRLEDISEHLDLPALASLADRAKPLSADAPDRAKPLSADAPDRAKLLYPDEGECVPGCEAKARIGYFLDTAFHFYYPENLEALKACGAELVPFSPLEAREFPDVDALYIGGGFPETHAQRLTQNEGMRRATKAAAEDGLPIYAECGGLIYLARSLRWEDNVYPMAGVFPVDLRMSAKPAGHGYALLRVDRENPYFGLGSLIKGHEFHYSEIDGESLPDTCFEVQRGVGLGRGRDGLLWRQTLAAYTHIHAWGEKRWAPALVAAARARKSFARDPNRGL